MRKIHSDKLKRMKQLLNTLKEYISCLACESVKSNDTLVMNCGHNICEKCIKNYAT